MAEVVWMVFGIWGMFLKKKRFVVVLRGGLSWIGALWYLWDTSGKKTCEVVEVGILKKTVCGYELIRAG